MEVSADRELVLRVRRGDRQAYGDLVRRHQQTVFNVCYRVLRNREDAEDLAQEAFVRAYEKLDFYDLERPFGPWVHRLAANLAINALRARKVTFELDEARDALPDDAAEMPEAGILHSEQRAALHAALAGLPAQYRAVLELRHFQGLSYEEIAAALDVPLNTDLPPRYSPT